jgi:hypothetical protein
MWLLLSSSIVGFLFILQNRSISFINSLPIFLLYIYGIETFGAYLSEQYKPNVWLYNYSSVVEFAYYYWLVSKFFTQKKARKKAQLISIIYCTIALANIIFFQGKTGFHTITFGLGSLILISICIYYFYQLLLFPKTELLTKQIEFWISVAILFSFVCSFPIFCLINFYSAKISESIWPTIDFISAFINIIFYSLFIVAFLCKIKFKYKTA